MDTLKSISVIEPKNLYLIRGLPGSGKTSLAESLFDFSVAADGYFDFMHGGEFIGEKLPKAHQWCQDCVERWMIRQVDNIAVHNTFSRRKEMQSYFYMAQKYNYKVHTIIVENRHGSESTSNVPTETLDQMEGRFDVQLR